MRSASSQAGNAPALRTAPPAAAATTAAQAPDLNRLPPPISAAEQARRVIAAQFRFGANPNASSIEFPRPELLIKPPPKPTLFWVVTVGEKVGIFHDSDLINFARVPLLPRFSVSRYESWTEALAFYTQQYHANKLLILPYTDFGTPTQPIFVPPTPPHLLRNPLLNPQPPHPNAQPPQANAQPTQRALCMLQSAFDAQENRQAQGVNQPPLLQPANVPRIANTNAPAPVPPSVANTNAPASVPPSVANANAPAPVALQVANANAAASKPAAAAAPSQNPKIEKGTVVEISSEGSDSDRDAPAVDNVNRKFHSYPRSQQVGGDSVAARLGKRPYPFPLTANQPNGKGRKAKTDFNHPASMAERGSPIPKGKAKGKGKSKRVKVHAPPEEEESDMYLPNQEDSNPFLDPGLPAASTGTNTVVDNSTGTNAVVDNSAAANIVVHNAVASTATVAIASASTSTSNAANVASPSPSPLSSPFTPIAYSSDEREPSLPRYVISEDVLRAAVESKRAGSKGKAKAN